jgi:hypothetical protein
MSTVRAAFGAACTIALCVALSAPALASRRPTQWERQAITRVGERTPHAGNSRVYVRNIRVSTIGPWASALLTIHFGEHPDNAIGIFHYTRGRWTSASIGTAGEWCVMPAKDQRNLGFPASYPCS